MLTIRVGQKGGSQKQFPKNKLSRKMTKETKLIMMSRIVMYLWINPVSKIAVFWTSVFNNKFIEFLTFLMLKNGVF